jgi:protein-S-isoprenylcysteine O-methyltransferase Ste14
MPQAVPSVETRRRAAARLALAWVLFPLFFLVTGGSLGWWQAWVYCGLVLVPMTVFGLPVTLALFILPGLDHRFGWSRPPLALVIAAQALALASYLALLRVLAVNRWAGRTIETTPGQQVVSTGPYAMVRHPMYATALVFYAATGVALGSWWPLIPAFLYVPVFVLRIRNEEEVLVRDLPGYQEYRARIRFRLVPGIW